jgi:hypothetical protein
VTRHTGEERESELAKKFVSQVARLYLSSELSEDEPVEPVEVLDSLIVQARELTGAAPDDLADRIGG